MLHAIRGAPATWIHPLGHARHTRLSSAAAEKAVRQNEGLEGSELHDLAVIGCLMLQRLEAFEHAVTHMCEYESLGLNER